MINFSEAENLPLKLTEVEQLWQETIRARDFPDETVNIKCVSPAEMRTLNKQYRGKDAPTNVLTFNYPSTPAVAGQAGSGQASEYDIALCLSVAEREVSERGVSLRDYVARLLVHAFLHATGMDHERSYEEARDTEQAERKILQAAGFQAASLFE